MRAFSKILFSAPTGMDGEDKSFQRVLHIAHVNRAELTIIDVLDPGHRDSKGKADLHAEARHVELAALAAEAKAQGIKVEIALEYGLEFIELIRKVRVEGHNLVVAHLQPAHGVKEWIFGGTAIRLLRKCPCPVWIMKPGPDDIYDNVLAAVDVMDAAEDSLNHTILDLAKSVCSVEKANLHILHSWEIFAQSLVVQGRYRLPETKIHEILAKEKAKREDALGKLLEDVNLSTANPRVYLPNGPVETTLPRIVSDKKIDIVVMGTVSRTGVDGFVIGNAAERILEQLQCSILAVKPKGFSCPLDFNQPS